MSNRGGAHQEGSNREEEVVTQRGLAVTLTHTRTRDIRQKRKKIWRTDWTAAVADVSAAAVARVVHEIG